MEVETAAGKYAVRFEKFALDYPVCFLKTARPVEGATPLSFTTEDGGPLFIVGAEERDGLYVATSSALEKITVLDADDEAFGHTSAMGPIVTASGAPVSFALSHAWWTKEQAGRSPLDWPSAGAEDFARAVELVQGKAAAGILPVTIRLRTWGTRRYDMMYMEYYGEGQGPNEFQAAGLYLRPGMILVLTGLSRRDTGRIESITAESGGTALPLEVEGAFSRYGILLTSPKGELGGAAPLVASPFKDEGDIDTLLVADRLTFDKFARDEKFARERVAQISRGFQGLLWPEMESGGENTFLFTLDGALVAAPMAVRKALSMGDRWRYSGPEESTLTMPAQRLVEMLEDIEAHLDRDYRVLSEDEARRLAWLGVETQPLDNNLARAKNVSLETEGGEIGAIVSHVYAGSPAARADLRAGDILLRLSAPRQLRPVNITLEERRAPQFPWAQLDQIPDMYFEQLPRPWPSRENELTRLLTEVGAGRTIVLSFLREGAETTAAIEIETGPKDFRSADKYEDEGLGFTVKNATYEVRRYFQMAEDAPGVVVADIKPGSRVSVAGLKPCEMITAVNAAPIQDVQQFREALAPGGEMSLTIQRMFESRVIQLLVESSGEGEAEAAEEEAAEEETAPAAEEAPSAEGEATEAESADSP
jgi:S1-C subfamily serine protease